MLDVLLSYVVLYGLKNNVVCSGSGAILFQREKMYTSFRYISTLFLMLGVALVSFATYFLQQYVYSAFNLEFMSVSVMVLFVGLYNFLVSHIWSKLSSFKNYLYKSSYSYCIDFAYTLSVLITLDYSVKIIDFALMMAVIICVMFVMNVVIGFFVETYNKSYVNASLRHVPSRLFLLAIISIILYYASLFF